MKPLPATLLTSSLFLLTSSFSFAAVPLRWTVETSHVQPVQFDAYHGETMQLAATLKSYGNALAVTNQPTLYWQTNGMADVWWTAPAEVVSNNILRAEFTPSMDPGAPAVFGYIGVPGEIYRAAFVLRFRNSPGAAPNVLPLPRALLDFATTTVTNAPYYTRGEVDANMAAATNGLVTAAITNGLVAAAKSYTDTATNAVVDEATIAERFLEFSVLSAVTNVTWTLWDGTVLHFLRRQVYNTDNETCIWVGTNENDTTFHDYGTPVEYTLSIHRYNGNSYEVDFDGFYCGNGHEGEYVYYDIIVDGQPDGAIVCDFRQVDVVGTGFDLSSFSLRWDYADDILIDLGPIVRHTRIDQNVESATLNRMLAAKQDALPYPTNAIPYGVLANVPKVNGQPLTNDITIASGVTSVNGETGVVELDASDVGAYSQSAGATLQGQVATIGAHLNAEDARFVSEHYDSDTVLPEANMDVKVYNETARSNEWIRIWSEMTRWNWFLGLYGDFTNAVNTALANKSEREYAFYDGVTGDPAPDGFFWISQPKIAICAGAAYQKYVEGAGAVWILESNGLVANLGGDTNGYFRVSSEDGETQFEIIKGTAVTVSAKPTTFRTSVMGVTHWHTSYIVTNAVSAPVAMFSRDLQTWYAEDDENCPCNVSWTQDSETQYTAEWWPIGTETKLFMKAEYGSGAETRIRQRAPVEMTEIVINGTKYTLGTATINGHTVLTLE